MKFVDILEQPFVIEKLKQAVNYSFQVNRPWFFALEIELIIHIEDMH